MVEDYSRVKGVDVDVIASMSFIDAMYNYLAFDPSEGFRLLDAFNIEKRDLSIDSNIIITQVYDRYIASNIKLMLMDYYHDDQKVWIVKSAGIKGMEHKKELDLYDLDREENHFDHLTSLYIPKGGNKKTSDVYDIVKGMDIGDIERVSLEDNPGMVNYTQEIDYRLSKLKEGLDRIKDDDLDDVMDLVGQGLMDILEVCEIGKDEGLFDLDEICERLKK